jgi:hypothetical protein
VTAKGSASGGYKVTKNSVTVNAKAHAGVSATATYKNNYGSSGSAKASVSADARGTA